MKAAVFRGPKQPLSLETVPTPEPAPGELLVRVAACGLCHTDLHYMDHGVPTFKSPPLILGHEASGTVAAVGSAADGWKEGDRVLLPAVMTCGRCRFCREGRENICESMVMLGNNIDGAYAEYVAVPAKDVLKLPLDLPLTDSCVIADALSTPFHAVAVRGRVRPGGAVVVVGCGGIGLNLVQMAVAVGAWVVAVDRSTRRLQLALEFGASATLNPLDTPRPEKELRRLTGGGADVAFEAVGSASTQRLACDALRKGGRLVLVGYSTEDMMLPAARVMYHELEVVGSLGCRPADYPPLIEMVRSGRVRLDRVVTARLPLDEINAGFDLVRRAEGVRTVVVP